MRDTDLLRWKMKWNWYNDKSMLITIIMKKKGLLLCNIQEN